jgi:uncharacterized protein (TIGR02217 family)
MAFYESPRFPDAIALGAEGGPMFSTDIAELASGYESRNITWDSPRHVYDVTLLNRPQTELDTLKAFFLAIRGMGHGFRFKDWSDYSATSTVGLLGTGVGTGVATYQMSKRYTSGAVNTDRQIKKPVSGTITVYKNAVAQTIVPSAPGSGQVSIDYTTGIVTFGGTAPGGGDTITWAGEFDVPVRFDTDSMRPAITRGGTLSQYLATWDRIPIREIRV